MEAGPQLLLQAFLQRVVNSGGRIEREYGLGRGRTDLLIVWPQRGQAGPEAPVDQFVIECKVLHKSLDRTGREGLEQTAGYMDAAGARRAIWSSSTEVKENVGKTRTSAARNVSTTARSPCGGCNVACQRIAHHHSMAATPIR